MSAASFFPPLPPPGNLVVLTLLIMLPISSKPKVCRYLFVLKTDPGFSGTGFTPANSRAARTIFAKTTEDSSPEFFVFYNGSDPYPKTAELKLSDAFLEKRSEILLELKIKVITINADVNSELLKHGDNRMYQIRYLERIFGTKNQGGIALSEARGLQQGAYQTKLKTAKLMKQHHRSQK